MKFTESVKENSQQVYGSWLLHFFILSIPPNLIIFYYLRFHETFNPFLANVPISHPLKAPVKRSFSDVFRGCKMGTLTRNGLMTNQSHVFYCVQFFSASSLLQQVWPSMTNVTSTNNINYIEKKLDFQLAANIDESKDNEVIWKHSRDQFQFIIINTQNSGL